MSTFASFLEESRKIRDISLKYGAYPISEEEALIIYSVVYERAILLKGINVVEVGSGCGYSSMWILKALKDSGYSKRSKMILIERNPERARFLGELIRGKRFSEFATLMVGDAKEVLKSVDIPVHIAFIDATKDEYHIYLELLEPNLKRGSIIFAHNFPENFPMRMRKYAEIVMDNKRYHSVMLPTSLSLSLSVKI
ncbi:MAG: hypothetical protein B6U94_01630 [Thermofilum sp. ex4484_79]|nr:MAG: hypothetical protein B6U94_01630 [Thermofilum sp. ex4484_79]